MPKPPKRDNRAEGVPLTNINALGGVQEGTHLPYVHLSINEAGVTLNIGDALTLASVITQAAAVAYQDSLLVRFWQLTGYDALQAVQELSAFREFRQRDMDTQRAVAQAASAEQPEQPEQPQPPQPPQPPEEVPA